MTSHAGESLPVALRTISPAVYKGLAVVAAVREPEAAESELSEQPVMDTPMMRKILKTMNIFAERCMH
jgi:hypothetical protein